MTAGAPDTPRHGDALPAQPAGNAAARLPSIRRRLACAMWIGSLLSGLAVALAVWLAANEEVDELLDDTLRASAEVMSVLLPRNGEPIALSAPTKSDERFAWQVVDASQRVVMHSARAPGEPFVRAPLSGFADSAQWRVYGVALGDGGRMLYVAQARAERAEAEVEVALSSVLAALAVGILAYFWLSALVRHEWAPVHRLSDWLAAHDPLAAGATLGTAERAELVAVHRAVDQLGQRLAQRLAQERAFAAQAAHALRTPLAGIDAQLAVCLRESPPSLQPRLQRVREGATRLQRVVAALLTLFRSDGQPQRGAIDLHELLRQFSLDRLQVDLRAAQPLHADADLLAAALANLLDNAQRHGASRVTVSTPSADTVRLDDDGPGVTPERGRALQAALDAQAYDDAPGLGLVLADLVARAHGGRLRVCAPASGRGFAVELSLGA
ncbi:MAG TPA: histidine kinase dimerization/phospho-acceptor domain-containing protein [Burkholderiaceae bacterium]|nr:histidine kinase dimerization/phospho-acceptor domain-containing protein [Burkholderiaceae bacterium]